MRTQFIALLSLLFNVAAASNHFSESDISKRNVDPSCEESLCFLPFSGAESGHEQVFRFEDEYRQCVRNTRKERALHWKAATAEVDKSVSKRFQKVKAGKEYGQAAQANGSQIVIHLPETNLKASRIINLNGVFNDCTVRDLTDRVNILYAKTNINCFFITQTVNFFIPRDSIDVYAKEIFKTLGASVETSSLVVGLWLKMVDKQTGKSSAELFVKEFGSTFYNRADYAAMKNNVGGNYEEGAIHKFNAIYSQIPKPQLHCLQVAQASGVFSSIYFSRGIHFTGVQEIYSHTFLVDKHLRAVDSLNGMLTALNKHVTMSDETKKEETINIKALMSTLAIESHLKPEFILLEVSWKERHLRDSALVNGLARNYLANHYPNTFLNTNSNAKNTGANMSTIMRSGFCGQEQKSDAIVSDDARDYYLAYPAGFQLQGGIHVELPNSLAVVLDSLQVPIVQKNGSTVSGLVSKPKYGLQYIKASKTGVLRFNGQNELTCYSNEFWLVLQALDLSTGDCDTVLTDLFFQQAGITNALLKVLAKNMYVNAQLLRRSKVSRIELLKRFYSDSDFRTKCANNEYTIVKG